MERVSAGFEAATLSRFSFAAPIDPEATSLTLTVDSYGEIVPTPEPMTIDVPAQ